MHFKHIPHFGGEFSSIKALLISYKNLSDAFIKKTLFKTKVTCQKKKKKP